MCLSFSLPRYAFEVIVKAGLIVFIRGDCLLCLLLVVVNKNLEIVCHLALLASDTRAQV